MTNNLIYKKYVYILSKKERLSFIIFYYIGNQVLTFFGFKCLKDNVKVISQPASSKVKGCMYDTTAEGVLLLESEWEYKSNITIYILVQ